MIRLTLNASSDKAIHLFNKPIVLIGNDHQQADLFLPCSEIENVHLKIIVQDSSYFLINSVNDPFAALNGKPFGKQLIKTGDVITLQNIEILFEVLQSTGCIEKKSENETDPLIPLLEQKITTQEEKGCVLLKPDKEKFDALINFEFPFEEEFELLQNKDNFEAPSHQVHEKNPLKNQKNDLNVDKSYDFDRAENETILKKTTSLKDDYLRYLDDDLQRKSSTNEPSHLYLAWKLILLFIFSLFAIAGMIGTIIYFTASDKAEAQETKAAQAVADIAIALKYAQINNLKPSNQNWSDVIFLKSNLRAILPASFSYANEMDAQGKFNLFPYNLRIYTSSDLSHFLLIAQPAPSVFQWLIPKSVILVDSAAMELRIVKDLRDLNRLLANTNPMDGVNGKAISNLVKEGSLIPLSILAKEAKLPELALPENAFSYLKEADNYIYNAPRYFNLGQKLIQNATLLSTTKGSSQDVASFKKQVDLLSKMNSLILYSSQGELGAKTAKQGFDTFSGNSKISFGFIEFNQNGKIKTALLLNSEATPPVATKMEKREDFRNIALSDHSVDANHPIYIQLKALLSARETELTPLANSLKETIDKEMRLPTSQFHTEFQDLFHQYLMINAKHKGEIKEKLATLYQEYEDVPIDQFILFANESGCGMLLQQNNPTFVLADENCELNFETLLANIELTKSLIELDNFIHIASSWLTFDYIKEPEKLIKYQNRLRNQVLQQIEKMLFSNKKHLNVDQLSNDEIDALKHLLSYERIIKPEERDYFLEEFNLLLRHEEKESSIQEKAT